MSRSGSSLRSFSAFVLLVFAALPLSANTIRVPADQATIQKAIDAASNGDTVLVSDGTYMENIDFKGKAITVKSVNGPATTIIDGGALDSVVRFATNEGPSSVLNGFTIRNGLAGFNSGYQGSGIVINNSSPTVTNNTITGNTGCDGVGIAITAGSPLVQGNTITKNMRTSCSGGNGGGGILIIQLSSAQIVNNTISGNAAGNGVAGGGISLFAAGTPTIRGNVITGNSVDTSGGGIGMVNDSDPLITDNVIAGNTAVQGGGLATLVPSGANGPTVINNTFSANNAPQGGSELYFSGFPNQTQFANNIFVGAATQIAVDCDASYSTQPPIFQFNDVFNPSGTTFAGSCTSASGTNNNISADPLFTSASDFHLQSPSPAIDAGSNSAPHLPTQDIAGNDRILAGPGHCTPIVDMGAYEFARPSSLTLNPTSLPFPAQVVGTMSSSLSSTITNTAGTNITVCTVTVTGDFSQTNTCGTSLPSKGSCSVNVTFTPTAHASSSGLLQIITNDAGSPQSIVLSGKGVIPLLSLPAGPLNFSAQQVGTTSAQQPVTLSNTGDGPLAISNVAATGDFSETSTCGASVAPAASCTINVTFAPTTSGNRTGSLTITDDAAGSPHSINLTGSATDFTLAVASNGSASASVSAGSSATYNLQVSALSGFSSAVSLVCTGAPSMSTCTVSPTSVTPGSSASPFTVSVATQAPSLIVPRLSARRVPPLALVPFALALVLASLLFFCANAIAPHPGRRAFLSSFAILLFSLLCLAACGGGGSSGPSNPGTPKGNYTLTVTGTANGVSHSLSLALAVN